MHWIIRSNINCFHVFLYTWGHGSHNKKLLHQVQILVPQLPRQWLLEMCLTLITIQITTAYWKNKLLDLLAMIRTLGPPTLFDTLSADYMHRPELKMSLNDCTYEEAVKKGSAINSVNGDPLLTALHFERRFKALLQFVLNGNSQPLGTIKDYFARVEFQNRGSPHMFFWIEGIPTMSQCDDREILVKYIDEIICTTTENLPAPLVRLSKTLQTHHHTSYCLRKNGNCRFQFPFERCDQTSLLTNVDVGSRQARFYVTQRSESDLYLNAFIKIQSYYSTDKQIWTFS